MTYFGLVVALRPQRSSHLTVGGQNAILDLYMKTYT